MMIRVDTPRTAALLDDSSCEGRRPPLVVIKFGGTALGTPTRICLAAIRVREQIRLGFLPVVVVSQMGKTSELLSEIRLVCLENGAIGASAQREVDRALSTGETLETALLAAAIAGLGIRSEGVAASEAALIATGPSGAARLSHLRPGRITKLIENRIVPVVAGFQGVRDGGEMVTLGGGNSDITAVFLASQLNATACHIVTDVDGAHEVHPQAASAAQSDLVPLHIYHYRADLSQPGGKFIGNRI
jgi:aspartate kinase